MSRVGKKEITITGGVKVNLDGNVFSCQGTKGKLSVNIPSGIKVDITNTVINLSTEPISGNWSTNQLRFIDRQSNASWGTLRQLINNSIIGVSTGFNKNLILEGVGFRASITGRKLTLIVGYSHNVEYILPETVNAVVENNTKIIISSCDKILLGKTASEIRAIRRPEPYKGKGIRYENEKVTRKAGKTGKK